MRHNMESGWVVVIILILIAILAVIGVAFALPRISANIKARADAEAVRINARANLINSLKSHGPHQITMDAKLNISVTPREYTQDVVEPQAQVEPTKATGVEIHAVRLIQASLNAYGPQSVKIMSSDDVSGNGMSPNTWGKARQWLIDNGYAMKVTVDGKESTQARDKLSIILAKLPSVDDSSLRSAITSLPRVSERGNGNGDRGIGQNSDSVGG